MIHPKGRMLFLYGRESLLLRYQYHGVSRSAPIEKNHLAGWGQDLRRGVLGSFIGSTLNGKTLEIYHLRLALLLCNSGRNRCDSKVLQANARAIKQGDLII